MQKPDQTSALSIITNAHIFLGTAMDAQIRFIRKQALVLFVRNVQCTDADFGVN